MRSSSTLLVLPVVAVVASTACALGPGVSATDPPSLTVIVHAGEVTLPGGKRVVVEATKLKIDPPEMRTAVVAAKAPRLYAKWFEPWEPWPKKGKDGKACVVNLTPKYDEKGVLILGGLFRAFDPATLKVTSADGSKTFVREKDYKFNAVTAHEVGRIRIAPGADPIDAGAVAGTLAKLRAGKAVKIAFMGASVMLGAEAGKWWDKSIKYTDKDLTFRGRVIVGLRTRFPKATITPMEAYQGGKTAKYGLAQLEEVVLPAKPDLLIVKFGANDAGGPIGGPPRNPPDRFKQDMAAIVRKARSAGIEVILIVGEQKNPWLRNGIDRRWPAYRRAILDAAKDGGAGVADVYTQWMRLYRRGIPMFSQLHNWNNHPGAFGHEVYAFTILPFFPAEGELPAPLPAARPPANTGLLAQPTAIPGKWELTDPPVPPLADILKRPATPAPVQGLYLWAGEYLAMRANIHKVGWRVFRMAGPFGDAIMKAVVEDGVDVMVTLGLHVHAAAGGPQGKKYRTDCKSDEAFIADYCKGTARFLKRYGPRGTFFKDHPKLPHRPIRAIEIWNEPNFQYMIPDTPALRDRSTARAERARLEAARFALYAKLLPARRWS